MTPAAPIRNWREHRVLDVGDSGRGESALLGHDVMIVRELEWKGDRRLPRGFRFVEVYHNDQLFPLIGRFRLVERTCMCPVRPYPHRWTRKCRVSPQ